MDWFNIVPDKERDNNRSFYLGSQHTTYKNSSFVKRFNIVPDKDRDNLSERDSMKKFEISFAIRQLLA